MGKIGRAKIWLTQDFTLIYQYAILLVRFLLIKTTNVLKYKALNQTSKINAVIYIKSTEQSYLFFKKLVYS